MGFRSVVFAVLLASVAAPPAAAEAAPEPVDRIVAVVNKDVILQSEVDELMAMVGPSELRGLAGEELSTAEAQLTMDIIDGLIANKLIDQAMDRAAIEVSDRDVEAAIADVAKTNGMTTERLFQELSRQGMDEDEYRLELKKQLRQYQFMNLEIRARVDVSDDDVRAAWIQMTAGRENASAWELRRLLLAFPTGGGDEAVQAVRDEAATLLAQLRSGTDFGEAAKARSDDASTKDAGGFAGAFRPKDLGAAFRDALDGAAVGDVVSVELPNGVWLLKVDAEVDVLEAEFEKQRDALTRRLYDEAMERELDLWTEEERRKAHVELFL